MTFSFFATPDFDFLTQFAQYLQVPVQDSQVTLPEHLGQGYVRKLQFGVDFRLTIHHYELREDLVVRRQTAGGSSDQITLFFYSNEQPLDIAFTDHPQVRFSQRDESAIQLTSNDLSSTIRFPAHHAVRYLVVALKTPRLKALLAGNEPHPLLSTLTADDGSFLFFESMSAEVKLLLKHITEANQHDGLNHFYTQVKVQELLYLVFRQLLLRDAAPHQPINSADAERLLQVRNQLLTDLGTPPVLRELAQQAAMSETKLKQLFKQTFGSSVYTYYQQARMKEAAFLLKQGQHSVAEVGYELGFSNLSHFSRLFEKHYGLNPKRYAQS
ncbi:helix-turn-helix transcriptional regulator [Hymenobacter cellulosilyticus]|uniref:AraC family transcriptional regulator n=1 Tax=Hymenobacter cellulosilyticus TaxID=2932248 RepID=A0A8T9Q588_9BACT|nr:AraC family transcriptional regulator [Hymenobacter cellulosilyticus]UOQ72734.1 AraC family transcriptional regulator [Hymenobacter cellulosilyticus]